MVNVPKLSAIALFLVILVPSVISYADSSSVSAQERSEGTWTILSYMNGDGNLEDFIVNDLMEMERIGSSENVNIVVQMDLGNHDRGQSQDATWTDTRRFLVEYHPEDGIGSTRLDDPPLGEVNMDDPDSLRDFLTWGLSSYPADHYMIALEGHADGVARGLMEDGSSTFSTSKVMSVKDLGEAIRDSIDATIYRPVDIISFDVCWMGMAEAAAEIMDHSLYMLGSFDEIPGAGWPYDKCLGAILNNTGIELSRRLSMVIDEYGQHYDLQGANSYASLAAVDLTSFKEDLLPPLKDLGEELYYTAYDQREVYDSLLGLVDKPRYRDDRYWDRYIDLYQYAELLSIDSRITPRVRDAAERIMATESDVLLKSIGGSNHPSSSRLFGIYYPTTKNDQEEYSPLVLSTISAWDEHAALVVEDIDINAKGLNWTYPAPGKVLFRISSSTPGRINDITVTVKDGEFLQVYDMIGSGGIYSKEVDITGVNYLEYRYTVEGNFGSFTYPPDGFSLVRITEETDAPHIWHSSPDSIKNSQTAGGLTFYVRDDSGIEKGTPQGLARLEYREVGTGPWYTIPMIETSYDTFRGWIGFWALPTGITPGRQIEYHMFVSDIYGNQARFPASGEALSQMAEGKRFYLDSYRSDISEHSLLMERFSAMGMDVTSGTSQMVPDLSGYKGYILLQPQEQLTETDVEEILDFHESGGELLVIIDPNDPLQSVNARWLMNALSIDVTGEGTVEGFYPANQDTELADTIPSIGGYSTGSLVPSDEMTPVYYTSPPNAAIMTGWYGKGRSVFSIPTVLDDDILVLDPNKQLSELMISYLQDNMLPEISMEADPEGVVVPGREVTFDLSQSFDPDGDIISYTLSVDNTYMEGPDPVFTHIFYESGLYNIIVKAEDGEEGVSERVYTIQVNRPPSTDHGYSTADPHAGEPIIFDYKGSDPDGDEVIVLWDFGDGFMKSGKTVSHSYLQRGIYTYRITVRDSNGLEVNKTGTITIQNSIPVAVIDTPSIRVNNGPANFTGSSKVTIKMEEGDVIFLPGDLSYDDDRTDEVNLTWYMGDGTVLYGEQISYRYETSGLFKVLLEVNDGFGGISNVSQLLSVSNRAPFAAFEFEDKGGRRIVLDASMSVDDQWDMEGLTYVWDLGDGNTLKTDDPEVEHRYLTGGRYDVSLRVEDSDGDSDSFRVQVEVSGITRTQYVVFFLILLAAIGMSAFFVHRKIISDRRTGEDMEDEPISGGFSRPVPVRGRIPSRDRNLIDSRIGPRRENLPGRYGKDEAGSPFGPPRKP